MIDAVIYSEYDQFAPFYNDYWAPRLIDQLYPIYGKLLLSELPKGARLLDVCCGTGHLAGRLTSDGFRVVGIDGSAEMLSFARVNAPDARLFLADARSFTIPEPVKAAVSTSDSLNHILSVKELEEAFRSVYNALEDGGIFVFDLHSEEGYEKAWNGNSGRAEGDRALICNVSYDKRSRLGRMTLTMFGKNSDRWSRQDMELVARFHPVEYVKAALQSAGFHSIKTADSERELNLTRHWRTFYTAVK